jgi:hypothetical protein
VLYADLSFIVFELYFVDKIPVSYFLKPSIFGGLMLHLDLKRSFYKLQNEFGGLLFNIFLVLNFFCFLLQWCFDLD